MSPRRAAVLIHHGAGGAPTLREHLVHVTEGLLGETRLHELTTRRIAREAGVSDGVLYNHFDDKTELVLAALVRRYGAVLERFEASLPKAGEGSVAENLTTAARALRDLEVDALVIGAGLIADAGLLHRFWFEIHQPPLGLDRLRRPFAAYLEAERELGRVRADVDVEAVVTLLFGASAMDALSAHFSHGAGHHHGDEQLQASVATIFQALAPAG